MEPMGIKGLVQVYTGDGKGKTTAALGQGLRAVGYGYSVAMVQFLKGRDSGEIASTEKLGEHFNIYRFDQSKKFFWNMDEKEIAKLKEKIVEAFDFIEELIHDKKVDILILDEIMGVLSNDLIALDRLIHILDHRPDTMEIILTGRNVPLEIEKRADLITEMKLIKHPFEQGIYARKGIEY